MKGKHAAAGRGSADAEQLAHELRRVRRRCRAVARDIHDGPFHEVTALSYAMSAAAAAEGAERDELLSRLRDWQRQLRTSLEKLRRAILRLERAAAARPAPAGHRTR